MLTTQNPGTNEEWGCIDIHSYAYNCSSNYNLVFLLFVIILFYYNISTGMLMSNLDGDVSVMNTLFCATGHRELK